MLVVALSVVGLQSTLSEGATIWEHVQGGTTISSLIRTAGLADILQNEGPFTLFIPSDMYMLSYLRSVGSSVQELQQDPDALKDLLLYHVVPGTIPRDQLYNELVLTAVNGQTIRINEYALRGRRTAQGVPMQSRDYIASNGIIHYLTAPMEPSNGTVADIVSGTSSLSTLWKAAQTAGIIEFLIDQNPITLFAPKDSAFAALGDTVNTLLENPSLLAEILKYHVVPGTLYTAGIHNADLHTFEEADKIHLTTLFGSLVSVDGAHVSRSGDDISATNGVVHKINKVLIPDSLKDQIP